MVDVEKYLVEFDIVINIILVGMVGNNESIINLKYFFFNILMSDIVYILYKIFILEEVECKGNYIYNGLDMFVY